MKMPYFVENFLETTKIHTVFSFTFIIYQKTLKTNKMKQSKNLLNGKRIPPIEKRQIGNVTISLILDNRISNNVVIYIQ